MATAKIPRIRRGIFQLCGERKSALLVAFFHFRGFLEDHLLHLLLVQVILIHLYLLFSKH